MNLSNFSGSFFFYSRQIGHCVEVYTCKMFFVGGHHADYFALGVIGGAGAVEGVDGLAVVLQADGVHVEQRRLVFCSLLPKDNIATVVLAKGIGGGGDVNQEINFFAIGKLGEGGELVVVAPAVLTEKTANVEGLAFELHADGGKELAWSSAQLSGQFLQAEEMAGIVKLPIVGHQGLDDKGIGHAVWLNKPAMLGDKEGIVLAHPAIIVLFFPVHSDIAIDNRKLRIFGGGDDIQSVGFAVGQEGALLPGVTQQVTGDGHFGEDDEVGNFLLGLLHHLQHF